jgi:xanthine dehydrogenase iron-sulfur cluster and FAD-binding subunit A
MAKTPLQFRHNGREVAIFVDGGMSLLSALRDEVGDHSPKFGCGQGGCGACTVLIDGEPVLSCITLAETVAGKSIETADGLKTGPELHPLQAEFMENFAAQCGYWRSWSTTPLPAASKWSKRLRATSAAAPAMSRSSTPFSPPPRGGPDGAPERVTYA